jgi:hypothetical protein
MQLPDEPSMKVRTKKETAEPQRTIELVEDGVGPHQSGVEQASSAR